MILIVLIVLLIDNSYMFLGNYRHKRTSLLSFNVAITIHGAAAISFLCMRIAEQTEIYRLYMICLALALALLYYWIGLKKEKWQ